MNLLIPSDPPKHLRITDSMLEDLLCDPVMAAWVFFKIKLDAFQAIRLRAYWFTPDVEDHSGFTSGKTIVDWVFCNLSAALLYDCHIGAIFQTFQIGKDNFSSNQHHPVWCNKVIRSATAELGNHPGFRVHREFEKEMKRGNPDYWAFGFNYKNYSNLKCHTGKTFKEQCTPEKSKGSMRKAGAESSMRNIRTLGSRFS